MINNQQSTTKTIPSQWTTEGFMLVYDQVLQQYPAITYFGAYQKAEELHIAAFGVARYKSYDSFRQTRKDFILKNK